MDCELWVRPGAGGTPEHHILHPGASDYERQRARLGPEARRLVGFEARTTGDALDLADAYRRGDLAEFLRLRAEQGEP